MNDNNEPYKLYCLICARSSQHSTVLMTLPYLHKYQTSQTAHFSIFRKSLHIIMFHFVCVIVSQSHLVPSPFIFLLTAKKSCLISGKYSKIINPFVNTQMLNPNKLRWTTWHSGCAKLFFHEFQISKAFSQSEKNTVCFKRTCNYLSN